MTSTLSNGKSENKKKKGAVDGDTDKTANGHGTEKKKEKKEKKEKKGRKKKDEKESPSNDSGSSSSSSSASSAAATMSTAADSGNDKANNNVGGSETKKAAKPKPKPKKVYPKDSREYYSETYGKCGPNAIKKMITNCFKEMIGVNAKKSRVEQSAVTHIRHFHNTTTEQLIWGGAHSAVLMGSTNIRAMHISEAGRFLMPGSQILESYVSRFPPNQQMKEFMDTMIDQHPLTRTPHHTYAKA